MSFHRPVFVGDELSVFGRLIKIGRTSMHVEVETWARDRHAADAHKVSGDLHLRRRRPGQKAAGGAASIAMKSPKRALSFAALLSG